MKMLWLIIGLIVFVVGVLELANAAAGVDVPHVTYRLNDAFSALPIPMLYSSIVVSAIGVFLLLVGIFSIDMGKYFNFY
ncbi:MAG: hypothetical protein M1348_02010 [Candidatus Parvarchaeota archaeon]|nr:hypothetical protein [Candidatus Parvarchaeota archaeon]